MSSERATLTLLHRIEQDWDRTNPDVDSRPMLTLLLLSRLQAALSREIERTYLPHGINAAGWDLLLTLYRSAPDAGLTPTDLSGLAAISGPSISNRIERLLARGLIERWPDQSDRRSVNIRLSAAGRELVTALLPCHTRKAQKLLSGLTEAEQTLFRELASCLVGHVEHHLLQETEDCED